MPESGIGVRLMLGRGHEGRDMSILRREIDRWRACEKGMLGGIDDESGIRYGVVDMSTKLMTQAEAHAKDACYYGANRDWLIAYSLHRDSDALERSNFRCFKAALDALPSVKEWQGEWQPVTIERSSHWAVGWIDRIIVDPACPKAIAKVKELQAKLENYSILDEEDFSREETDEADEVWKNCYSVKDRIAYVRRYQDQFDFCSLADMIGCIRGKYFAGYASELLH